MLAVFGLIELMAQIKSRSHFGVVGPPLESACSPGFLGAQAVLSDQTQLVGLRASTQWSPFLGGSEETRAI